MTKAEAYAAAKQELQFRLENERDLIANLANASAVLYQYMEKINWVGFYLYKESQLVLGPFQGLAARVRIPVGNGVCGTAAAQDAVQLVPDVHAFPGHIACDLSSRSEIVVPIHANGQFVAVLDIDSPEKARFDEEDQQYLQEIVAMLEKGSDWTNC